MFPKKVNGTPNDLCNNVGVASFANQCRYQRILNVEKPTYISGNISHAHLPYSHADTRAKPDALNPVRLRKMLSKASSFS